MCGRRGRSGTPRAVDQRRLVADDEPHPRTLAEDFLARCVEDWVSPAEAFDVAQGSGASDPVDLRDLALGLVARLLEAGLVVPGEVVGGVHRPWTSSPAESVSRIVREWAAREDPLVWFGEIAWFDVTPAGQAIGEQVLAREAHPS